MFERHSLVYYYSLTFIISWGVVFLVIGPNGFPATPELAESYLPLVVGATLLGPTVASVVTILLVYGNSGLKRLWNQFFQWQIWYIAVPLLTPLTISFILVVLSLAVSPDLYTPSIFTTGKNLMGGSKLGLVSAGLGYGLAAGIFEELGWTGFAVQELMRRGSDSFVTGVSVGLIWGIWHFFVAFWGSGRADGEFSFDLFVPWIPWNFLVLPAFRVIMVHIFYQTESVLLMAAIHGSLTASLPLILMPPASGTPLALFYILLAVAFGLIYKVFVVRFQHKHIQTEIRKMD